MIELLHIDCMSYMAGLEDNAFDLAIVDPPYRDENQPTIEMRKNGSMESLRGRPSREYWDQLRRVTRNQIIWGANNFELCQWKGFVVWEKCIPEDFTMSMAEVAALSEDLSTVAKIYKQRASGADIARIHPTQKPVKLYQWLLKNYAKEGDRILDTHLGSGSSAIAAHYGGFDFVGCEIDKDYYDAAVKRFGNETAQQALAL